MRYKGCKIYIKLVRYDFDYLIFNYPNNLLIYINKDLDKKLKSKILHKAIKKARY